MMTDILRLINVFFTKKIAFDIDLIPVVCEEVPYKKILNWILTEGSVHIQPGKPLGFPTVLQVEPTTSCNLRCRICPVTTGMNRPSGHMAPSLFRKIVDELSDYLLLILFWDWGEPFLNPYSCEMINYAHTRGIKVISSTNGHVFANGDHAREVVKSGLDVLVFSVDGTTQETYEMYRTSGKLDQVLEGIRKVKEQKKSQNSETPLINLRFIVMKHNEHEIPKLTSFARSVGVDNMTIRKYFSIPNSTLDEKTLGDSFMPSKTDFQLPELSGQDRQPVRIPNNLCKNLWNCPTIHWDGTVCSCFLDFNEERPLGNLEKESFKEIWYSRSYKDLRKSFRKKWQDLPLCKDCSCGFKGGDVGSESNVEILFFS
jgi:radical SAM protein with 4Fe4S-binding SPASM domain